MSKLTLLSKVRVASVSLMLVATSLVVPAETATAAKIVCKPTTAKPHAPMKTNPPQTVAKKLPKQLILRTNCGPIEIALDPKAPFTVTQISALARAGYYNKSLCHRLTTEGIYVLQCGDPTASGSGSPTGWTGYLDENLPKATGVNYPAGTVAMANSGPKTNGSQFFLVYKDTVLGPNYTIWGKITKGLDQIGRAHV